jgi:hypothetical protein
MAGRLCFDGMPVARLGQPVCLPDFGVGSFCRRAQPPILCANALRMSSGLSVSGYLLDANLLIDIVSRELTPDEGRASLL